MSHPPEPSNTPRPKTQPKAGPPSPADIPSTPSDWDERYGSGDIPWESGRPSPELIRVLDSEPIAAGRALELGCGTGVNAVYLASRGFEVTGVDVSELAIERARARAADRGVRARFVAADVSTLDASLGAYDFVFDRGCYHCVRQQNLAGYLCALERLTRAGTRMLLLAGNANEPMDPGPPVVREGEILAELGGLFALDSIAPFRFDVASSFGDKGPLAWCCLLTRK